MKTLQPKLAKRDVAAADDCIVPGTDASRAECRKNCKKSIRSVIVFAVTKRGADKERLPRRSVFCHAEFMWAWW
jgi:hypothetical protein